MSKVLSLVPALLGSAQDKDASFFSATKRQSLYEGFHTSIGFAKCHSCISILGQEGDVLSAPLFFNLSRRRKCGSMVIYTCPAASLPLANPIRLLFYFLWKKRKKEFPKQIREPDLGPTRRFPPRKTFRFAYIKFPPLRN